MRRFVGAAAGLSCVASVVAGASPTFAGSAAQPGQTIGLPVGAQLPIGLYFVNTSSYGVRSTSPRESASNINLPAFAWSTPFKPFGARLQFFFTQPVLAVRTQGAAFRRGTGQQLYAGQLAFDLGHDIGFSYLLGGYLPTQTPFTTRTASLTNRFALSYTGNGFNLTANVLNGTFLDHVSPTGTYYPNYVNLDLTATRKFGKWSAGPVAFGSTDLTASGTYRRQSQFAVGGLVGYNFGPMAVQAYLTRDVAQRNYGGFDTRGWLRVIVPFAQDKDMVQPDRILVTRRQGS